MVLVFLMLDYGACHTLVCVCVCACVRACVRACVCFYVQSTLLDSPVSDAPETGDPATVQTPDKSSLQSPADSAVSTSPLVTSTPKRARAKKLRIEAKGWRRWTPDIVAMDRKIKVIASVSIAMITVAKSSTLKYNLATDVPAVAATVATFLYHQQNKNEA